MGRGCVADLSGGGGKRAETEALRVLVPSPREVGPDVTRPWNSFLSPVLGQRFQKLESLGKFEGGSLHPGTG